MKDTPESVTVSILGKEFMVVCPEAERRQLTEAAAYLDQKMREIHATGRVLGAERAAIMAALNITHELLQVKARAGQTDELSHKIKFLQKKIDAALVFDARPSRLGIS